MKIIRLRTDITVILEDGTLLTNNACTDELYNQVLANQDDDEEVRCLLIPEFCKKKDEIERKEEILSDLSESKYLSVVGKSLYVRKISELSVPEDLAMAIYNAEKDGKEDLLISYLNFWTLCSLNPDSRARTNLFWFLDKYGMSISKSGLFVAYRNVKLQKEGSNISSGLADFITESYSKVKYSRKKAPSKFIVYKDADFGNEYFLHKNTVIVDPEEEEKVGVLEDLYKQLADDEVAPTYTDSYTGKFRIKIGEAVTMPRESCDAVQENTCSRGLHVAGKDWLRANYFGGQSLVVLVNPADVVAVPPDDNYGKMRTCAYYPIATVKRDSEGQIVDQGIDDGFEDDFLEQIAYTGEVNNDDTGNYQINIPTIPELDRKNIIERLQDIKNFISDRDVTD